MLKLWVKIEADRDENLIINFKWPIMRWLAVWQVYTRWILMEKDWAFMYMVLFRASFGQLLLYPSASCVYIFPFFFI